MKFRFLALLALVLGLASCQNDPYGLEVDSKGEAAVTLNVALPDDATRAAGTDSAQGGINNVDLTNAYDIRYILEVYNLDGSLAKERMTEVKDTEISASFSFRLVPGRDYKFVVWADFVNQDSEDDLHYDTSAGLDEVKVKMANWSVIDESRDAYTGFKVVENFSSLSALTEPITLTRPFAKLRVVTNDIKEMISVRPAKVKVEYFNTKFRDTFDAFTETASGEYTGHALTATLMDSEENPVDVYSGGLDAEDGVQTLFADYFFGAVDDRVMFTMEVTDNGGVVLPKVTFNTNIPVKRNNLTTVYGPVLTDSNNITVTIKDAFENDPDWNPGDDKYDVEIWDGKSLTEPKKDAEGNYVVNLASELAWLAAAVNGTLETRATVAPETFNGKTFKLTQDINLDFNEWTPIGNSKNSFQGTFDGQGHTIANLLITGNKSDVGLFGFTTNGEIKNLVVENAKVSGYLNVAVVAGTPYTSKYSNITVKGHVEVNGFSYVGTVGGKNAYANWNNVTVNVDETSYVKANSIEGSKAFRTYVGGVTGFNGEGGHSFTNITSNIDVKGSTCDVGGLFGIAHYGNQFENCSCSGDVEIYATEEAELAQEIGGIAGVWNNEGADVVFANCTFTGTLKTNIAVDFYYDGLVGKPYKATGTGKLIIDGYEMVATGVGLKDGEYFVMSAQGLAWVEAQEDKYFAGKTIKLANDIDMTGVTIEKPIHFWNGRTTFDGQDYTISNLTMSTTSTEKKPFGLFGGTADIKNVKFDKANISGYSYVAVVAGNLYGNIDNCHVSNSYVTCTYWMAGAMSGQYNAGNVTNCSVTNTTIKGPAAVGALVGNINETAGERKVENCTVTGCTVAQNGSFGGVYDKMFGTAVGLVNINNSKVYINGCKVEDTTVKGATSANIFGHNWGDNTTIYVDGYTYGSDGTIKDEVTGNLIANSPESLEAALETAGAPGAGDTTIVIAENAILDMNNTTWTPIYVDGYNGADIVTVEGNGATLKGLTAPLFKGGFAGGSGIVIKNLTITDSNIVSTSTQGSGAFIECADSMEIITLDNCHFTNSSISGSRTGGLVGWTSGYSEEDDGPVKTYVTIKNCSVIDVDINATGSAAAINGHAGASDWTYTTIENCTVKNCNINSTDSGSWRTGIVVGTANVGEVTISNITESGNTLTQTGKTAPEGFKRNYYGRFVPVTTGKLTIDGYKVVAEGLFEDAEGNAVVGNQTALEAALENALENAGTVVLTEGTFIIPDSAQGKTVTFIGSGDPEDTVIATQDDGSYEGCDYSLDGSTVVFEKISINTDSKTYTGYARCKGTYKNCIINGTYTLYGDSVFEDCTFNVSGDVYNIWTWGAPKATFTRCTFNCDGKAMLLYGTENTKLTMNNCVFNDKGGLADLKAAIEIGNDYNKSYELIVNEATVNGFEINDKGINTGTTLWANKNSMGQDKLNVVVDGVDVY